MYRRTIMAFEIPSTNLDRAVKFYGSVLGEEVDVVDFEGHEGLKKGILPGVAAGVTGSIVCVPEYTMPSDQGVNVYLHVADLEAALREVERGGGSIVVPKTDGGGKSGDFAWIIDSEGNRVALNQPR